MVNRIYFNSDFCILCPLLNIGDSSFPRKKTSLALHPSLFRASAAKLLLLFP